MNNIIRRKWNQNTMVTIEDLRGFLFQAEENGHTFEISGIDGTGAEVALSGTPSGVLLREDGQDVTLTCSVSEGVVRATLPAGAYAVPGRFGLTIFLTSDSQTMAIYAAVGTVGKTSSGQVAPPAAADITTLINQITAAIAAIPVNYNANFAPAYSTSGLYAVGQYVTYNGNLYRCIAPITSGESWTAAHWVQVSLGAEVSDAKSILNANTQKDFAVPVALINMKNEDVEIVSGGIKTDGTNNSSANRVRTDYFNTKPNHKYLLVIDNTEYRFLVAYGYNYPSYSYPVSRLNEIIDNQHMFITTSSDMICCRVSFGYTPNDSHTMTDADKSAILAALHLYEIADGTLTGKDSPAEAYSTGEMIGEVKDQILSALESKFSRVEIDTGEWYYGAVSTTGITISNKKTVHSGFLEIGDYDYIDIEFADTDMTYQFVVYQYDSGTYSLALPGNNPISIGGVHLENKGCKYIISLKRVDDTSISISNLPAAKEAVKVYAGKSNGICYTDNIKDVLSTGKIAKSISVPYAKLEITTSGYNASDTDIATLPFSIGEGFDSVYFDASNISDRSYAVYGYNPSTGSYSLLSGGWVTTDKEFTDKNTLYICRIRTGVTAENFYEKCNLVGISFRAYSSAAWLSKAYGYNRMYVDITSSLTFERKAISTEGISDSTVSLLAELPNDGNIECRLNAPSGKFAVWKKSGNTYTCLSTSWTYYQYRYTGDYSSKYYIAVADPSDSTITLSAYNYVEVLKYLDAGEARNKATSLTGKKIAFFGDSIVQGRMCKNGNSVNHCMSKPFANLLSELAGVETFNYGIGGAQVSGSSWKSLLTNYEKVTGFDVVFICAGTNDFGQNVALETFESAYTTVLTGLVSANTKVVVCTPTRRSTNSKNTQNLYLSDYANAEKEIAESFTGVQVIDLYSLTNTTYFKNQLTDGLHPNEIGHGIIADLINNNY